MTDEQLVSTHPSTSPIQPSISTVTAALELLTATAMTIISQATVAGVSLLNDSGRRLSTAATSQVVLDADEVQYRLRQGPCMTAWKTSTTVRVDDVQGDPA